MAMDISLLGFMVVDDDAHMLDIIAGHLGKAGAQLVRKCGSGKEAADVLSNTNYTVHCVISDYSMSPISGLQLLQRIRAGGFPHVRRELPFIMVTVSGKENVVRAAMALDVGAYVIKPVTAAKLTTAIERTFSRLFTAKEPAEYLAVNTSTD